VDIDGKRADPRSRRGGFRERLPRAAPARDLKQAPPKTPLEAKRGVQVAPFVVKGHDNRCTHVLERILLRRLLLRRLSQAAQHVVQNVVGVGFDSGGNALGVNGVLHGGMPAQGDRI